MPNNDPSTPLGREPSVFQIAVGERSWDWLLELRRQLKVDLLLVDEGAHVLVSAAPGDSVTGLPTLLEQRDASVLSAITTGLRVGTPQVMGVAGLQIVSLAVSAESGPAGALVLGRAANVGQEPLSIRVQLELVGSWLRAAVESHLKSPPTQHASGLDHIRPLAALLRRAAEHKSDRELIRVFGEAVAVWHDIETCGYVETSGDAFLLDVVPPAVHAGERPASLAAEDIPDATELIQLPQGHLDRFQLPMSTDVFVKRFRRPAGSWLLVFTGTIDSYDLQRLTAYVALLDLAVALSAAALTARLTLRLSSCLAEADAAPAECAGRALDELRAALGASWARLTIEGPDPALPLAVMSPGPGRGAARGPAGLGLVKRSEQDYTTAISLGRATNQPFTPCDHEAAGAALEVFAAWRAAEGRPAQKGRDRRSTPSTFPETLERSARETMARGAPVAMIVVRARSMVTSSGSTQRWVAGIRGQMRALDLVGVLAESEVGVLLPGTNAERATRVFERIRGVVEALPDGALVLLGLASRSAGARVDTAAGLVDEARAAATGNATATKMPGSAREARS